MGTEIRLRGPLARKHTILAIDSPKSHTNFATTVGATTGQALNIQRISSGAQNAFIEWDLPMDGGTWTFDLMYRKDATYGIYTISVDGVSVGTIDGYAGVAAVSNLTSVTGIVVAPGMRAVRLTMATKNASSSNYTALFNSLSLVRTGA